MCGAQHPMISLQTSQIMAFLSSESSAPPTSRGGRAGVCSDLQGLLGVLPWSSPRTHPPSHHSGCSGLDVGPQTQQGLCPCSSPVPRHVLSQYPGMFFPDTQVLSHFLQLSLRCSLLGEPSKRSHLNFQPVPTPAHFISLPCFISI